MERHRFDPLSAFFGIIFTGSALVVLLTDEIVFSSGTHWVWPVILLVAGFSLIVSGVGRSRDAERAAAGVEPALPPDPYAD